MRPTRLQQSAIHTPLNHILGTEANVRVLRVILLSDIPIGVSELARRTALQASGVARVCTRLEDLGVIDAVGRGSRNRQYRRAERFPLTESLTGLFRSERSRGEAILRDVRMAVGNPSSVRAAWIEGPVALGIDEPGDPIIVGALVEPTDVDRTRRDLWQQLLGVQSSRDVAIELRLTTLADLKTLDSHGRTRLEKVIPLIGPSPLDLIAGPAAGSATREKRHKDIDLRSLEVARLVAERIRRDPSVVEDAKRYIERRMPIASPGERLELQEWEAILSTMSLPRLRRFLIKDDERATRLRQSSPFLMALSREERKALFDAARKQK